MTLSVGFHGFYDLATHKALKEALLDFKVKAEPIRSLIKKSDAASKATEKPKGKAKAKKNK